MGATIPPDALPAPARCHGHKHWMEWTVDEKPSQYHLVVRYSDAEGEYLGSSRLQLEPALIRQLFELPAEEAEEKFQQVVALYEAGKTPDEIVIAIEAAGFGQIFSLPWKVAVLYVDLPE
jgi:hypothetical protein